MAVVYVFNNNTNRVEKYYLGEDSRMPYSLGSTLSVREFRARSCSSVLWTDKRVMESWNNLRGSYGRPIPVGAAFKRIWEGGHGSHSQHYAGTAFDVGQTLTQAQRTEIYNIAVRSGVWSYVEPLSMTPSWVHVDKRFGTPACARGGFPMLRQGDKGVYVFVAQDSLAALGFPAGGLDGVFGSSMRGAVSAFQRSRGLSSDGVIGCNTWEALTGEAVGIGETSTVIDKC